MSTKNDGGPAFPHLIRMVQSHPEEGGPDQPLYYKGMSLRDYFAAAALPGLAHVLDCDEGRPPSNCDHVARDAYAIADAMLAERERKDPAK